MKPGSIIIVKPFARFIAEEYIPFINWLPIADEKTLYVIRQMSVHRDDASISCVVFEEGVIGIRDGIEIALDIRYVREIQAPGEINIEELLKQPEYA